MSKASGLDRWACPSCDSKEVKNHKKRATKAGMVRYQPHCGVCGSYYTVTEAVAMKGGLL